MGQLESFNRLFSVNNRSSGFTLIELVVVIVILGILSATALPKFMDLAGDANQSAILGVAGAIDSAVALNVAGCALANQVVGEKCARVQSCAHAAALLNPPLALGNAPSSSAYYTTTETLMYFNGCTMECTLLKDKTPGDAAYHARFTLVATAGSAPTFGCVPAIID